MTSDVSMFLLCPREARRGSSLLFLCSVFVLLREYAYNKIFLACYCVVVFGQEAVLLVTMWSAPSVCLVLYPECPSQSWQHLCKVSFPSLCTCQSPALLSDVPHLHQAACRAAVCKESGLVFSGEVWEGLPERSFGTAQSYGRCQDLSPPSRGQLRFLRPPRDPTPAKPGRDWLTLFSFIIIRSIFYDTMRRVKEHNTALNLHEQVITILVHRDAGKECVCVYVCWGVRLHSCECSLYISIPLM